MDVSFLPASRCISYASYERSWFQYTCWLGFDRYKKILYGIKRKNAAGKNPIEREIVMCSIYRRQVKVIETIKFANQQKGKKKEEISGLSSCGGYVAIIQYISKYGQTTAGSTFHLYSTEDGLTVKYHLIMRIQKSDRPSLLHSSIVGWLLAIPTFRHVETEVHRFIFNEDKKICWTELLTKTPSHELTPSLPLYMMLTLRYPIISGTNLIYGSPEDDTLHIFDLHTKSWSTRVVDPTDVNNHKATTAVHNNWRALYYLVGSEDEQNLFGVQEYFTEKERGKHIVFKLLDNIWKPLFSLDNVNSDVYPTFIRYYNKIPVFVAPGLMVIRFSSPSAILLLNTGADVPSLQNLAAKEFLITTHVFGKEKFLRWNNIPTLMRRQYFGPIHSWKEDKQNNAWFWNFPVDIYPINIEGGNFKEKVLKMNKFFREVLKLTNNEMSRISQSIDQIMAYENEFGLNHVFVRFDHIENKRAVFSSIQNLDAFNADRQVHVKLTDDHSEETK